MLFRLLLPLHFLLSIAVVSKGQYTNVVYTKANGLPNNNITCIKQDKEGFLWIGTSNGLCRFDGTHFYTFPMGLINSNRLAGDLILDLEEENDYMWVAHRFGVSRINKHSFVCENFQDSFSGPVYTINRAIRDIYKDNNGTIWLAGDKQLLRFDNNSINLELVWDIEKNRPAGAGTQVGKIISGGSGKLLLYLVNGWVYYNIESNVPGTLLVNSIPVEYLKGENLRLRSYWNTFASNFYMSYDTRKSEIMISLTEYPRAISQVKNIYVDSDLNVYANCENDQVAVWASNDNITKNNTTENKSGSLYLEDFNYGYSISGLVFWGRPGGLYITDKRPAWATQYFFSEKAFAAKRRRYEIRDTKEFDESNWLVAADGGLFIMNRVTHAVKSFERWNDSLVYTAAALPGKTIWLSTANYIYHFNPLSGKILSSIFIESYAIAIKYFDQKLLVATRANGILLIDLNNNSQIRFNTNDSVRKISHNRITSVKPAEGNGKFMITYNDLGLFSYNNFITGHYMPDTIPVAASVFKEQFALTAVQPGSKKLWIGQYIGGVLMYDSVAAQWTNFTKENGLTSNYISEILNDKQGRTWIVTDGGIDIYDPGKKSIYKFPLEVNYGGRTGGFISRRGSLVFFDREKITETYTELFRLDPGQKKILFSIVVQDKNMLSIQNRLLKLPYNRNSISIIFSLQKLDPDIITRYSYRLRSTENWTDIGSETELNFASLQPGKYDLHIRATDEFGQWAHYSDILSVTIRPPFWNTWWFYLLIVIVIFAVFYMIYRYRMNQLRKVLAMRTKISQDLHDEVGATLSGVTLMSELAAEKIKTGDTPDSQRLVERIKDESKEMAEKMNDIVWAINPVNDSMEKVLIKIQAYGNNLCTSAGIQFHFSKPELKDGVLNMQVRNNIYLISKEAINNAVKYSGAGNIRFSLSGKKNNYVLLIEDDGVGFDTGAVHNGNGLINIRSRAKEMGGDLSIRSAKGNGTLLELHF